MDTSATDEAPPKPAADGPLDGVLRLAIDGIASYAADAVRDGLVRLTSGVTGSGQGNEEKRRSIGPGILLAVAVAAIVTALLASRDD